MKIFLDTADIDEISKANTTGMIEGITTNPTLIKASGMDPVEVIKEISSMSNQFESVSAEVVADTAEEMIDQAMEFEGLWNVTIKVPCTVEGRSPDQMGVLRRNSVIKAGQLFASDSVSETGGSKTQ